MARKPRKETAPEGALTGLTALDKLLEHRVRLAVCVLLARYDRVSFARFKELTGETDGNLGANLRKLEDSAYVAVDKRIVERKPLSTYSLTEKGRKALDSHVRAMKEMLGEL